MEKSSNLALTRSKTAWILALQTLEAPFETPENFGKSQPGSLTMVLS